MMPENVTLTIDIGGVSFSGTYPGRQHPKYGPVVSAGSARKFELDAVAFLVGRDAPLNGDQLLFMRQMLGLTQSKLGALLQKSRMIISRFENADRTMPLSRSIDCAIKSVVMRQLAILTKE